MKSVIWAYFGLDLVYSGLNLVYFGLDLVYSGVNLVYFDAGWRARCRTSGLGFRSTFLILTLRSSRPSSDCERVLQKQMMLQITLIFSSPLQPIAPDEKARMDPWTPLHGSIHAFLSGAMDCMYTALLPHVETSNNN